jgi:hypothetical protein
MSWTEQEKWSKLLGLKRKEERNVCYPCKDKRPIFCPECDTTTSKLVENTKAFELTMKKEVGKLTRVETGMLCNSMKND